MQRQGCFPVSAAVLEYTDLRIERCVLQSASPRIQRRVSNGAVYISDWDIRHSNLRAEQPQENLMHDVFRRSGIRHEGTCVRHQRRPMLVVKTLHVLSIQCFFAQSRRPLCVLSL